MSNLRSSSFNIHIPDSAAAAALSRSGSGGAAAAEAGGGRPTRSGVGRAAAAENGGGRPTRGGGGAAAAAENGGGRPTRVGGGGATENGGGRPTSMEAERKIWTQRVLSMFSVQKYMVPTALGLAVFKYQGNKVNPFDVNPMPTWCLLIATSVFFLIVGALKANYPRQNRILFHISIHVGWVSGLVSMMSSISIFIPRRYSFLALVAAVAVVAAVLAWPMLRSSYNWIADRVNNIRVRVANWWSAQDQGSSLPV